MNVRTVVLSTCIAWLISTAACAGSADWTHWVAQVRQEALSQGIRPAVFDEAFSEIHEPSKQIKGLAHSQPEHRLSYMNYRNSRVDNYSILMGRKKFKEYHDLLESIGKDYGVDPCFVVSFWGLETSYGSYMGTFPVIKSLATPCITPILPVMFFVILLPEP